MHAMVKVVITRHALHRIRERAGNPHEVLSFLTQSELTLLKNCAGYEITIPLKGRIVGDFEDETTFIAKSFKHPFRFGKEYFTFGKNPTSGRSLRVSSLVLPRGGLPN
jgi:hypothetical protein